MTSIPFSRRRGRPASQMRPRRAVLQGVFTAGLRGGTIGILAHRWRSRPSAVTWRRWSKPLITGGLRQAAL